MRTALFIAVVVRTWVVMRLTRPYRYRARHRGSERAPWAVYVARRWHGSLQTHRSRVDMGTSVWALVSPDIAKAYGRE